MMFHREVSQNSLVSVGAAVVVDVVVLDAGGSVFGAKKGSNGNTQNESRSGKTPGTRVSNGIIVILGTFNWQLTLLHE